MSLKFLSWNINQQGDDFIDHLERLAGNVDVLLLCESQMQDSLIYENTGLKRVIMKSAFDEGKYTPKMYTRLDKDVLQHYSTGESKRIGFYTLRTKELEIILAGLHFPSKLFNNTLSQHNLAITYANWIRDIENLKKSKNTIVFGDFNMNPFDDGMISPKGFNATLSYKIAKAGRRKFHYQEFDYFYNPMWNWLGDRDRSGNLKLPGSFYYDKVADSEQVFWNVFDKVLVRPDVIDILDYSSICIEDVRNFKSDTMPTDHFPLSFRLDIKAYGS